MYINLLNDYLKKTFGDKVYKISLNAGFSCPNRDGKIGIGGCIFCSKGGSGDFAQSHLLSITEQLDNGKALVKNKIKSNKYIAYFQAFTNTYAPVEYLRKIYYEAVNHKDVVGISIATRPDCIDKDIADLLREINEIKPVFIELGLQTSNETSAQFIRRGYSNKIFENSITLLYGLNIVVHLIIGLPFENDDDIINTIKYINKFPIHGVKLQLLHILSDTDLYEYYKKNPFKILSLEEYGNILISCIKHLRPDIVIHRLTGDGPKKTLVEPAFSANKRMVLNYINNRLRNECVVQGSLCTINRQPSVIANDFHAKI
ncbi:MAG: TIGR01212 family radical SAM protein [Lachnospiraceae bacterium]|nr:TIGR01212 family radical SAM protein [Lachnospiraceae bacterium]